MKDSLKAFLIPALVVISAGLGVQAQGLAPGNVGQKSNINNQGQNQQLREEVQNERCEIVNNRLVARIEVFERNKELRQQMYANMKELISSYISKLNEKGYDTAKLVEDLSVLDEKIQKIATDYTAVIDTLKEAQGYTCGDSAGMFKEKVQEARDLLKIVKDDAADIRAFWTNTIKEDIKDIRAQSVETTEEN